MVEELKGERKSIVNVIGGVRWVDVSLVNIDFRRGLDLWVVILGKGGRNMFS